MKALTFNCKLVNRLTKTINKKLGKGIKEYIKSNLAMMIMFITNQIRKLHKTTKILRWHFN